MIRCAPESDDHQAAPRVPGGLDRRVRGRRRRLDGRVGVRAVGDVRRAAPPGDRARWWQFGTYRWWTENPPLPKMLTALGPYLAGVRLPGPPATLTNPWDVGTQLLEAGGARTPCCWRAWGRCRGCCSRSGSRSRSRAAGRSPPGVRRDRALRDVPAAAGPRGPGDDGHRGGGDGAGFPAGARSLGRPPDARARGRRRRWRWRSRRCAS